MFEIIGFLGILVLLFVAFMVSIAWNWLAYAFGSSTGEKVFLVILPFGLLFCIYELCLVSPFAIVINK